MDRFTKRRELINVALTTRIGNIQFENIICPLCKGKGYSNDGFEYEYKKQLAKKYKRKTIINSRKSASAVKKVRVNRKNKKTRKSTSMIVKQRRKVRRLIHGR